MTTTPIPLFGGSAAKSAVLLFLGWTAFSHLVTFVELSARAGVTPFELLFLNWAMLAPVCAFAGWKWMTPARAQSRSTIVVALAAAAGTLVSGLILMPPNVAGSLLFIFYMFAMFTAMPYNVRRNA